MTAKERILMLRLIEKAEKYPDYMKKLVVEAPSTTQTRKYVESQGPHDM